MSREERTLHTEFAYRLGARLGLLSEPKPNENLHVAYAIPYINNHKSQPLSYRCFRLRKDIEKENRDGISTNSIDQCVACVRDSRKETAPRVPPNNHGKHVM